MVPPDAAQQHDDDGHEEIAQALLELRYGYDRESNRSGVRACGEIGHGGGLVPHDAQSAAVGTAQKPDLRLLENTFPVLDLDLGHDRDFEREARRGRYAELGEPRLERGAHSVVCAADRDRGGWHGMEKRARERNARQVGCDLARVMTFPS